MGRLLVIVVFSGAAAATGSMAWGMLEHAWADDTVGAWAIVAHGFVKLAVICAFTYFVAVRGESKRTSRSPVAVLACVVALVAIVFVPSPDRAAAASTVLAGDLVAVAFGIWLLASVLSLGRCFGILPEARGLVTRGPYGLVRHPVYLGEIGVCAGLVIASPTFVGTIATVVVVAAQFARMRFEEQALIDAFPSYRDYAARTPRLVPSPRRQVPVSVHIST